MVDKTKVGVIGTILLLVAFGGSVYLTPEQIEDTFVCNLTGEIQILDRLSDSHKTGYRFEEINGTMEEIPFKCRIGRTWDLWLDIETYCELHGKSVNDLLNPKKESEREKRIYPPGTREDCTRDGCKVIN